MTPADLVIRDAEAADLPAVRALLVETWHATYDGIYGWQRVAEITNAWHSLENLGAQLGRENGAFLVALVGSEIVATASARTSRRPLGAFGKIRTTRLCPRLSSLTRSSVLVDVMGLWCATGNGEKLKVSWMLASTQSHSLGSFSCHSPTGQPRPCAPF